MCICYTITTFSEDTFWWSVGQIISLYIVGGISEDVCCFTSSGLCRNSCHVGCVSTALSSDMHVTVFSVLSEFPCKQKAFTPYCCIKPQEVRFLGEALSCKGVQVSVHQIRYLRPIHSQSLRSPMTQSSTAENHRGSRESMNKSIRNIDEADSTKAFKNGRSFEERLCETVQNSKRSYDVSYKEHHDK